MRGGCNAESLSHLSFAKCVTKEKTHRVLLPPWKPLIPFVLCLALHNLKIWDNFHSRHTLSIKKVKSVSVASGMAENGFKQEAE